VKLSEIREICAAQKTALEKQELGLERQLLPELLDIQSHALVISGIRRCGKSTLLRQFVQKLGRPYFYLNFDDIRLAAFSTEDYRLREIKGLLAAMDFFNQERGIIITFNSEDSINMSGKEITVIPAWKYQFSPEL
jgi:predicted AAA+ superfamily ATPase